MTSLHSINSSGNSSSDIQKLLHSLVPEVLQAERSAQRHPRIEASRLEGTPPAEAMLAVSQHADGTLPVLLALLQREGFSTAGTSVGVALSLFRTYLMDRLVNEERSYRGTLAGMRHGVDVLISLAHAAQGAGLQELSELCAQIAQERELLVAEVARALSWFTAHPGRAIQTAQTGLLPRKAGDGHNEPTQPSMS